MCPLHNLHRSVEESFGENKTRPKRLCCYHLPSSSNNKRKQLGSKYSEEESAKVSRVEPRTFLDLPHYHRIRYLVLPAQCENDWYRGQYYQQCVEIIWHQIRTMRSSRVLRWPSCHGTLSGSTKNTFCRRHDPRPPRISNGPLSSQVGECRVRSLDQSNDRGESSSFVDSDYASERFQYGNCQEYFQRQPRQS